GLEPALSGFETLGATSLGAETRPGLSARLAGRTAVASGSRLWRLPLRVSLLYLVVCRLLALLVLLARGDRSKELEILVLRHELAILRRRVGRPRFESSDRFVLAALSRVAPRRSWSALPVRPETLACDFLTVDTV